MAVLAEHRSSLAIPVLAAAVCVGAMLLLATAAFAVRTGPSTDLSQQLTLPAVRPVSESVAPAATSEVAAAADWVSAASQQSGVSPTAVRAYGNAALQLAREQPACHLGWTTIAGIGGIESGHGTTDGTILLDDGTTSPLIIGPALDGSAGMAAIRSDAESVQWHGDPRWDHAVGPMQFIPSTWRRWGADGNGDGISDPNNINDAAFATARYLCASGADLRTGAGWSRAIFSYNHSDYYVRSVLARANSYAAAGDN